MTPEEHEQNVLYLKALGLVDSEYENLKGFTIRDMWDYLASMYQKITRDTSDRVFLEFTDGKTV